MNMTFTLSQPTALALQWDAVILLFDFMAVMIATICDLISALRKSRRSGIRPTSRGFRRTVDKLLRYFLTLIALATVDSLLILLMISLRSTMGWTLPALPVFTTVGAIAMASIEIKSVVENSHASREFYDALTDTARSLSDLIDNPDLGRLISLLRRFSADHPDEKC